MAFTLKKRTAPDSGVRVADPGEGAAPPEVQQAHPESGRDAQRPAGSTTGPARRRRRRWHTVVDRIGALVQAIQDNDEAKIEQSILRLSRRRRVYAPLAFAVGAFVMLFEGLKLLASNWRLVLVQILPAMWIWLAMLDLKLHVLYGHSFNVLRGPVLIPLGLLVVAITVASFFLNAVFAFAISRPGRPEVRPALAEARRHLRPIVASGAVVGLLLAFSTLVVTRWGRPWFTISLGIVVGVMMVCYLVVPSRLIGLKPPNQSRRERLAAAAVNGALSVTVCTPPYVLGRLGILLLGSRFAPSLVLGVVLLFVGVTLQAGATGSVRAIKLSATLTAARRSGHPPAGHPPAGSAPAGRSPAGRSPAGRS